MKKDENLFVMPLEDAYANCVRVLKHTGILNMLPHGEHASVTGIDGKEYILPSLSQIQHLVSDNYELIQKKVAQGFDLLLITPLAVPASHLIDIL